MSKRIAVLAPGGVGSILGGLLTKAGHDVTLIDQWPEHVEAIKERGLRISLGGTLHGDPRGKRELRETDSEDIVKVRAYHLYEVCVLRPRFDVVFLTSKSYDSAWLTQFIEPYLDPNGVIVSVQNSINEEWIAPIVGPERVIGCVLNAGGYLFEPAHVWRFRTQDYPDVYTLGELDGRITPRVEEVAAIMGQASKSRVIGNLRGARWSKLVHNSMTGVMAGLGGRRTVEVWDHPNYFEITNHLGSEAIRVGQTLGYDMEPIFQLTPEDFLSSPDEVSRKLVIASSRDSAHGYPTLVLQDLLRGRPSEVGGYLNGLVIRKGREAGVPTPVNEAATGLFLRVERGEIPSDRSNFDLVKLPEAATLPG